MKPPVLPPIIIDTREQDPLLFSGFDTVRAGLKTGDYSIIGYESKVAVERKSKADAYQCVGKGRARFISCLERLAVMDRAAIVIECSAAEFVRPPPYTRIDQNQAFGSFVSWSCRYRLPLFFAGDRRLAERIVVRFLGAYVSDNDPSVHETSNDANTDGSPAPDPGNQEDHQ